MIHIGAKVMFKPGHAWAGKTGTVTDEDPFYGWRISVPRGFSYVKEWEVQVIEDATGV